MAAVRHLQPTHHGADSPALARELPSPALCQLAPRRCDRTPEGFSCVVPAGSVNPRVRVTGYGKAGDNYVCITGNPLTVIGFDSNGKSAFTMFNLYNDTDPQPSGSGYNLNAQSTACA